MLTIPPTAPFSGAQKMWLKGYLDALSSAFPAPSSSDPRAALPEPIRNGIPLTIAWGSQTGTSESLGKKLAKTLTAKGHSPTLKDMAEITPEALVGLGHLLIITSTYGDGEPPDNAALLHSALHAPDAPALNSLHYSVLALGDSNYAEFCKCGRDFDQRLATLGATRLAPIIECDVEYEEPFTRWLAQLEQALAA